MLKVLVTGITGMLGAAIAQAWQGRYSLFGTASRTADAKRVQYPFLAFGLDSDDYEPLAAFCEPDVVVNCAAVTDHALCEKDPEYAYRVNASAVKKLAETFPCAYTIHISTDAVFSRDAVFPNEDFMPLPFSIYGKSKYEGERLLLQNTPSALVLRTTVVGIGGRRQSLSLAEWIIRDLQAGRPINLFSDALFTPINVWDFALVLEWCIGQRPNGLLHAAGSERVSKYDFGVALARECGLDTSLINEGLLADSPNSAGRRFDQSLSSERLEQLYGASLPGARDCVAGIARRIS